jgi:catechol 2,3-dioxygenase-like lactoylglutathione lyase family enzyme
MISGEQARPVDSGVRIGHVHLKVADLERSLRFYCGVLGFELTQRYGTQAAFVSASGYHHHIGREAVLLGHFIAILSPVGVKAPAATGGPGRP